MVSAEKNSCLMKSYRRGGPPPSPPPRVPACLQHSYRPVLLPFGYHVLLAGICTYKPQMARLLLSPNAGRCKPLVLCPLIWRDLELLVCTGLLMPKISCAVRNGSVILPFPLVSESSITFQFSAT